MFADAFSKKKAAGAVILRFMRWVQCSGRSTKSVFASFEKRVIQEMGHQKRDMRNISDAENLLLNHISNKAAGRLQRLLALEYTVHGPVIMYPFIVPVVYLDMVVIPLADTFMQALRAAIEVLLHRNTGTWASVCGPLKSALEPYHRAAFQSHKRGIVIRYAYALQVTGDLWKKKRPREDEASAKAEMRSRIVRVWGERAAEEAENFSKRPKIATSSTDEELLHVARMTPRMLDPLVQRFSKSIVPDEQVFDRMHTDPHLAIEVVIHLRDWVTRRMSPTAACHMEMSLTYALSGNLLQAAFYAYRGMLELWTQVHNIRPDPEAPWSIPGVVKLLKQMTDGATPDQKQVAYVKLLKKACELTARACMTYRLRPIRALISKGDDTVQKHATDLFETRTKENDSLSDTRSWLAQATAYALQMASEPSSPPRTWLLDAAALLREETPKAGSYPISQLVAIGYMQLIMQPKPVSLPETVQADSLLYFVCYSLFHKSVVAGVVATMCSNEISSIMTDGIARAQLLRQVTVHVATAKVSKGREHEMVAGLVDSVLQPSNRFTVEQMQSLRQMLCAAVAPPYTHPVYTHFSKEFCGLWLDVIVEASNDAAHLCATRRNRMARLRDEAKAAIVQRSENDAVFLGSVVRANLDMHASRYADMLLPSGA